MRYIYKGLLCFLFAFTLLLVVTGCKPHTDMPFNGTVTFHELVITIPEDFIRDSTQSGEDGWVFEKGLYSQLIIITRSDINGDTQTELEEYGTYMAQQGAYTEGGTFMGFPAVLSLYEKDDMYCQEILFAYNNSFYAVALRGGTEEEFGALLDSLSMVSSQ